MIGDSGFDNTSWFLGYVEDNTDRNGRVRVRALGFHPPAKDNLVLTEDLPWAHVVRNSKFVAPLDNGDMVVGFFADGRDAQFPIVIGTINSAKYSLPTSSGSSTTPFMPSESGPGYGGTERAKYAYQYLIDHGYTPAQAAGMVGNLQVESGPNLDNLYNPNDKGLPSYGIAQWRGSRAEAFRGAYGVYPNEATLDQQLEFMIRELDTTHASANQAILNSTTPQEAAYAFDRKYEVSDGSTINQRVANANELMSSFVGSANNFVQYENPYIAPSQDAVNNFGQPALPPQATGEDIEYTPILTQAAVRKDVQFTSANYGVSEPSPPMGGSVSRTAVWHTRYGGSNITMSGKDTADEYIDITHATGSRVTLDGNGNITIKAMGRVFIGSEGGDVEEDVGGVKVANYAGGYAVQVSNGKTQIFSNGNIELNTGQDLILNAGAKIVLNAGDVVNISGTGVSATAEVDAINLVSAGKIAMSSKSVGISLDSTEGMFINSGKKISIKSGEDLALGSGQNIGLKAASNINLGSGGNINLNSPGADPAEPDAALTAVAPPASTKFPLAVATETKQSKTPSDLSPSMTDDVVIT